MIRTKAII